MTKQIKFRQCGKNYFIFKIAYHLIILKFIDAPPPPLHCLSVTCHMPGLLLSVLQDAHRQLPPMATTPMLMCHLCTTNNNWIQKNKQWEKNIASVLVFCCWRPNICRDPLIVVRPGRAKLIRDLGLLCRILQFIIRISQ